MVLKQKLLRRSSSEQAFRITFQLIESSRFSNAEDSFWLFPLSVSIISIKSLALTNSRTLSITFSAGVFEFAVYNEYSN